MNTVSVGGNCFLELGVNLLVLWAEVACGLACPLQAFAFSAGCMLCLGQSTFLRFNHPAEAKWMKSMIPAGGRAPGPPYNPGSGRYLAWAERGWVGGTSWTPSCPLQHSYSVRVGQCTRSELTATYHGLLEKARQRSCWERSKAVLLG